MMPQIAYVSFDRVPAPKGAAVHIAAFARSLCRRLVYEVNGLPSIELKYHYPAVADDRELLAKLRAQEQACLDAADLVITPSQVTAGHLADRGVAQDRLHVIPNGVDLDIFTYRAPRPWQDRPASRPQERAGRRSASVTRPGTPAAAASAVPVTCA